VGSNDSFRRDKCAMIGQYGKSEDVKGLTQVITTLVPFALLWWAAIRLSSVSLWLAAATLPFIVLLNVRSFGLMHECGHGSLFRSHWLNRTVGFALGILSGMPQYVWSQHHNYHHAHNGNWDKYRGPYATLSVDEYASLTRAQQRLYRFKCSMAAAPLAGFIYLILNPRLTWMRGSIGLVIHTVKSKLARPSVSLRAHAATYETRYWKSAREYRHMLANNLVLLSIWGVMCIAYGPARFFPIYVLSVSIAGGVGIVLFTVQHNFRHAYAADGGSWDQDTGTLEGTSYLVLPRWLNWFTVDIGYHHVHHLSASIPNYRLAACHDHYRHLFSNVTRITPAGVLGALRCILWDKHARRIISLAEYQSARALSPAAPLPSPAAH
jgi:omega-6 fatty acid desaturase (delta-12 desaturase)